MIIAFSHPADTRASRLFDGLAAELAPLDLLSWPLGSPAPAQNIQILLATGAVQRPSFEGQEQLELVQTLSAGYESVDLEAASDLGIWVSNAPSAETGNAASVAEFAVMLLIGASRHLVSALRADHFGTRMDTGSNRALSGKTVCVVGLGGVGRHVVELLRSFNVHLVATEHGSSRPPTGVTVYPGRELRTAVATADYVVLCVPGSKANENLMNASVLGAMKPGAILVNVARGSVVNEVDLCLALRSGQIAAVGLDVLRHEPPDPADPLLAFPQALVTPHIAGDTDLTLAGTIRFVGELVSGWGSGGKPDSVVNTPAHPRKAFAAGVSPQGLRDPLP